MRNRIAFALALSLGIVSIGRNVEAQTSPTIPSGEAVSSTVLPNTVLPGERLKTQKMPTVAWSYWFLVSRTEQRIHSLRFLNRPVKARQ